MSRDLTVVIIVNSCGLWHLVDGGGNISGIFNARFLRLRRNHRLKRAETNLEGKHLSSPPLIVDELTPILEIRLKKLLLDSLDRKKSQGFTLEES